MAAAATKLKGAANALMAANKMAGEAVKVVVRCRPLNQKELNEKRDDIVTIDKDLGQISIRPSKDAPADQAKTFTFNAVYGPDSQQRDVYDETAFPLVEQVFDGYNGTIFAYGQTGCGKSWSMMGVATDDKLRGIIPNAFLHVFERIAAAPPDSGMEFLVRASYIEIYNEQVRDLLGSDHKASKDLKEDPEKVRTEHVAVGSKASRLLLTALIVSRCWQGRICQRFDHSGRQGLQRDRGRYPARQCCARSWRYGNER